MFCLRQASRVARAPAVSLVRGSSRASVPARFFLTNSNRRPDARRMLQKLQWTPQDPPLVLAGQKPGPDIVYSTRIEAGGAMRNIVLNRPQDLNVLNFEMVDRLNRIFKEYANREAVMSIVVRAEGRHFSAGEDLRWMLNCIKEKKFDSVESFMKLRNEMILRIALMPQPFYLCTRGVTAGAAAAMAIASNHCTSHPSTVLAFPQHEYGWFVDGAATYFLAQLRHRVGHFLALTGLPLYGYDVRQAQIAEVHSDSTEHIEHVLADCYTESPVRMHYKARLFDEPGHLRTLTPEAEIMIDRCFSKPTVAEIMTALEQDSHPLAKAALNKMRAASPLGLMLTHQLITFASCEGVTLEDIFRLENRVARRLMRGPDFRAGLEAYFENRTPQWSLVLDKITPATVDTFFVPLSPQLEFDPSSIERPTRNPFDFYPVRVAAELDIKETRDQKLFEEKFAMRLAYEDMMRKEGLWYQEFTPQQVMDAMTNYIERDEAEYYERRRKEYAAGVQPTKNEVVDWDDETLRLCLRGPHNDDADPDWDVTIDVDQHFNPIRPGPKRRYVEEDEYQETKELTIGDRGPELLSDRGRPVHGVDQQLLAKWRQVATVDLAVERAGGRLPPLLQPGQPIEPLDPAGLLHEQQQRQHRLQQLAAGGAALAKKPEAVATGVAPPPAVGHEPVDAAAQQLAAALKRAERTGDGLRRFLEQHDRLRRSPTGTAFVYDDGMARPERGVLSGTVAYADRHALDVSHRDYVQPTMLDDMEMTDDRDLSHYQDGIDPYDIERSKDLGLGIGGRRLDRTVDDLEDYKDVEFEKPVAELLKKYDERRLHELSSMRDREWREFWALDGHPKFGEEGYYFIGTQFYQNVEILSMLDLTLKRKEDQV